MSTLKAPVPSWHTPNLMALCQLGTAQGLGAFTPTVPTWHSNPLVAWHRLCANLAQPEPGSYAHPLNQPSLARAEFFWASENSLEIAMT